MLKLYRFEVDYGRHGSLEGLFVSTEEELNLLNNTTIHFGEALGKHSEVWIDDFKWQDCCSVVSDDQEKIEWLVGILGYTLSGYSPSDYYEYYESEEYTDGYNSTPEDECPCESEGDIARWMKGLSDKLNEKEEIDED